MALTNTQYDDIMRSYAERQRDRERLIAERKAEVTARDPRMAEIDSEIAQLGVREVRRRVGAASDGEDSATDVSAAIGALSAERREVLTALGYPADYLDPPYTCPDCQDTGYIDGVRCHCLQQAIIDRACAGADGYASFADECFANFRLDYYAEDVTDPGTGISSRAAAQNAYDKCRRFVADFDDTFQNIYLFGDTGVGKTFLSHCIAGELIQSGHSVLYFSAGRLFDALADRAFGRAEAAAAGESDILTCDLLIIDDLGTELPNSFTLSRFFMCVNERILHGRSTVISSNLALSHISSIYSERVFSRIIRHYTVLHLFGNDIRVQTTCKEEQPHA